MLVLEKGMFTPHFIKKNNYFISRRDFTDDYSIYRNRNYKIDMTLSGSFLEKRRLYKERNFLYDQYPHPDEENNLIEKISKKFSIPISCIVLGAGCNGIFQNLIKIFFQKKGNLVTPYYSFSQPEYAVTSMGSFTKRVYCKKNYEIDFTLLRKAIDGSTRAVFICNPNNPTGICEANEDIIEFAKSVTIPIIVSEASHEFSGKVSLLEMDLPSNIIVVKSFSKAYGLAGLRIGFALMSSKNKEAYLKNTPQFTISSFSINVARFMLNCPCVDININRVIKERNFLSSALGNLGIETIHSDSNILMSKKTFPNSFFDALEELDVAVVKIQDYANLNHFRIAVQQHMINKKFIKLVKRIVK